MSDRERTLQEQCYGTCWAATERIGELETENAALQAENERLRAKVEELEKEKVEAVREALTIQALRMRNEVFRGGGMGRKEFEQTYLSGDEYERELAKREGIEMQP